MGLDARLARLEAAQHPAGAWIFVTYRADWPHGPAPDLPAPDLPAVPSGTVRVLYQALDADPPAWDWARLAADYPDMEIRQ
jgi:hypothetical protein